MQQAIDTFKLNIDSVKQLDAIYQYLEHKNVGKALDLSEILRAEIVLAVSAMDNFISDVLHFGLVHTFEGNRVIPDFAKPFNDFQVDMQTLVQIINAPSPNDKSLILGEYIRKVNSKNPYQDPKQIESALLLLGIKQLWTKLGIELSTKGEDVRRELANIVWQRHKIAHEADFDHLIQKKRTRDRATTLQAIEFIEKLCNAIYKIVMA